MKVIIAGSRTIHDYQLLEKAIDKSGWFSRISEIVSGNAKGVDRLGEMFARNHKIPIKLFPANWNKYGISAGYKRNYDMGKYADSLIAIIENESKGTKSMIGIMQILNKPVFVLKNTL